MSCGCGICEKDFVLNMLVVLGQELDIMILEVFSSIYTSMSP